METRSFETLFQAAQRGVVVAALHRLPDATLADLCAFLKGGGEQAALLEAMTISELTTAPILTPGDVGPPIDRAGRREGRAQGHDE